MVGHRTQRIVIGLIAVLWTACDDSSGPDAGGNGAPSFVQVSAGGAHSCGLSGDGRAFCWGANSFGQLGDGSTTASATPVAVMGDLSFAQISAGGSVTCGVTVDGVAHCWGFGPTGNALTDSCEQELGELPCRKAPAPVEGAPALDRVVVGGGLACGLGADGRAHCWSGLDGTPAPVSSRPFVALAAGTAHVCALSEGGQAFCWGSNDHGQLGVVGLARSDTPVAVMGDPVFTSIAAGGGVSQGTGHSCGVSPSGAVRCWGGGLFRQLGRGGDVILVSDPNPAPVAGEIAFQSVTAGTEFTCGLATDGAAHCWGSNASGQAGGAAFEGTLARPTPVDTELGFTMLDAGGAHVCGLTADGRAFCWGRSVDGRLGGPGNDQCLQPPCSNQPVRVGG